MTINEDECRKAKEILKKRNTNTIIWRNKFAPSRVIGNCSKLYQIHEPEDYQDFFNKYTLYSSEYKNTKSIAMRGLTEDELNVLAWRYKVECEANGEKEHDVQLYLNEALCHIIIETFDGKKKERDFKNYLRSKGYTILKDDFFDDTVYGIDIKAVKDNKTTLIQIKPLSFFVAERPDTQRDRINLAVKHEMTLEKYGIETMYAIYDSKTGMWLTNNNKGLAFSIDELFKYDKNNIENNFERIKLNTDNMFFKTL